MALPWDGFAVNNGGAVLCFGRRAGVIEGRHWIQEVKGTAQYMYESQL
ncbi:hypothetical protein [Paenibacillus sp.]|nr:hypothetical protein [Paenibacillus sp.]